MFVLATMHERLRLLLVWEITSDQMKRFGILKTETSKGATSLVLPIATVDGHHKHLEQQVFGSKVYTGVNREAARFLKVYPLPVAYCIPKCMRGRDPVIEFE